MDNTTVGVAWQATTDPFTKGSVDRASVVRYDETGVIATQQVVDIYVDSTAFVTEWTIDTDEMRLRMGSSATIRGDTPGPHFTQIAENNVGLAVLSGGFVLTWLLSELGDSSEPYNWGVDVPQEIVDAIGDADEARLVFVDTGNSNIDWDTLCTTGDLGDTNPDLPEIPDQSGAPDALFSYTIPDAVGGNAPLVYTFTHNSDWMSLSGQVISGTPDIFGTWTATVTVTDDDGDTDSSTFDVVISVDTAPSLPAIDDNELTIDQQFEYQIGLATGGNGTLTYSMTGNPSWASLALNFTETVLFLSGTPTETGEWTITITVTDADGDTGSQTFTLTVVADFTVPNLPAIPDQTAINGVAF